MPTQPDDKWRATYVMIGKRLRWARELIYDTQAEFARALDVDKSTINKIENGDRSLSIETLIYAANKLQTGADYLLFGELLGVDPELRERLVQRHPELYAAPPIPARRRKPKGDPPALPPQVRYRVESDKDADSESRPRRGSRRVARTSG